MDISDYERWTAIGTVGAVAVALGIALAQATVAVILAMGRRRRARRKVASLVSAWIEVSYSPQVSGDRRHPDYYRRSVSLHLANESDEPVFKVEVVCGIATEDGNIQVGPLAAPRVIPVLPPKREFVFDVTMGMLGFDYVAHDTFHGLIAMVGFYDHETKRWERAFDGKLNRDKKPQTASPREATDALSLAQAGPVGHPRNPMTTLFGFTELASDFSLDDAEFKKHLVEHAPGWADLSLDDVRATRKLLSTSNIASHVWYPTPRIAYVRLLDSGATGDSARATVVTLVWRHDKGWTLFGEGRFLPWDVPFDFGELERDPLDERQ